LPISLEVCLKRFLYGFGVFVGLLVAGLVIAPSFVNWNDYREAIASQVEGFVGRPVTIEGDLAFTILPSPALSAKGVRIANVPGASTVDMVRLESLDIEVAFMPLLRGVFQVEQTVLVRPVVNLEMLQDGRFNLSPPDSAGANAPSAAEEDGLQIALDSLLVEDGTLTYVDAASNTRRNVTHINTAISAKSISGPFTVKGEVHLDGTPSVVDLSIGSVAKSRFPVDAKVGVPGLGLAAHLTGVGFSDDTGLLFEGEIDASIDDSRSLIKLISGPGGASESAGQPVKLSGRASLTTETMNFENVDITYGTVKGHGELGIDYGAKSQYKMIVSLPVIDLDPLMDDIVSAVSGPGEDAEGLESPSFELPEGVQGSLDLSIEGLRYQGNLARQVHLTAALQDQQLSVTSLRALLPGGSDLSIGGVLSARDYQPEFRGQVRAGSSNLRTLLTAFDIDLSAIPKDRLTQMIMRSALTVSGGMLRLPDIELKVDTTTVTGGVVYSLKTERPSFGVNLVADRFNADVYQTTADTPDEKGFDANRFVQALSAVDVNGSLAINQLTMDRENITGLTTDLSIGSNGVLVRLLVAKDVAGGIVRLTDVNLNGGEVLSVEGEIQVETEDFGRFRRFVGLKELPMDLNAGALKLSSSFSMQGDDMTIDGQALLDGTSVVLRGGMAYPAGKMSQVNVQVELKNDSWAQMARLVGVDAFAPLATRDVPVIVRGTIIGAGEKYDLNMDMELGSSSLDVSGSVTQRKDDMAFSLSTKVHADEMVPLFGAIGMNVGAGAADQQGSLLVSATLAGTSNQFKVQKLAGNLGASVFKGDANVTLSGGVPVVKATVQFEELHLGTLMGEAETGAEKARANNSLRWSSDPIDLSGLESVNAEIDLSAQELLFRDYRFVDPHLQLKLGKGGLAIPQMTARLFGGDLVASGQLSNETIPILDIKFQLGGASVAQALAASADLTLATGRLAVSGEIHGQGNSQKALVASLSGEVDLLAEDGVVQGVNMVRMSESMLTLVEYDDFIKLLRTALNGGETKYERFHAPFKLANGIATTGPEMAILEASQATVNATIDLPRWAVDADIDFKLTDPGHEKTPTVGLRLYGAIDDPKRKTKAGAMTAYIGRRLASRLLEDFSEGEGNSGLRQLLGGSQSPQPETSPVEGDSPAASEDSAPSEGATEETPPEKANPFDLLMQGLFNELDKSNSQEDDTPENTPPEN
jgi:uncharacterized protein involved in outer membrane biogenesis